MHKVLFLPSKSLFPQSCLSSGCSKVVLMVISSKGAYATFRSAPSRAPGRPLMTQASTRNTQTLKGRSGSVSVGSPHAHKFSFESSECLWRVWGLILNTSPLLILSCWGFAFVLGHGVSFSAARYYFGVLTGDEHKSFYSAILWVGRLWMNHDLH